MKDEVEQEIKEALGVKAETLRYEGLFRRTKRKGEKEYKYYEAKFYDLTTKKIVSVHVPVKKEELLKRLDARWKKLREKERRLKEELERLIRKYRNPVLVKEVLERVLSEALQREAKDYAYERYKSQALELFEKLKPYLLLLKRAKVRRIKPLEALYLLAGVSEGFKDKDEDKALKRALQTIVKRDRNKNLKNPFGVLKSDFFLKETPYEFLLSSFLQEELNSLLDKLLETELQKAQAQEFLTKASDLVAELSPKAKERVLKVFGSFSEFTGTLYRHWQTMGEEIETFLRSWKNYLEMETQNEEEEKSITDSLKRLRESVNEPHDQ